MTKRTVASLWAFLCILLFSNLVTIWLVVQTRREASQAQAEASKSHEWARNIGQKLDVDAPYNDASW